MLVEVHKKQKKKIKTLTYTVDSCLFLKTSYSICKKKYIFIWAYGPRTERSLRPADAEGVQKEDGRIDDHQGSGSNGLALPVGVYVAVPLIDDQGSGGHEQQAAGQREQGIQSLFHQRVDHMTLKEFGIKVTIGYHLYPLLGTTHRSAERRR